MLFDHFNFSPYQAHKIPPVNNLSTRSKADGIGFLWMYSGRWTFQERLLIRSLWGWGGACAPGVNVFIIMLLRMFFQSIMVSLVVVHLVRTISFLTFCFTFSSCLKFLKTDINWRGGGMGL